MILMKLVNKFLGTKLSNCFNLRFSLLEKLKDSKSSTCFFVWLLAFV